MKTHKNTLLATIICITLFIVTACNKSPEATERTTNPEIKVELLFEYDGVKVYRFYDGRAVYYTDARGKTSWAETKSYGKSAYTVKHNVETVR